jgi:nucleoside-diphosphate-sugar epimerase
MTHARKNLKIEHDLLKPTIKNSICLDTFKANQFGWEKKISLDDGIEKTLKWSSR